MRMIRLKLQVGGTWKETKAELDLYATHDSL